MIAINLMGVVTAYVYNYICNVFFFTKASFAGLSYLEI